MTHFLSSNDVFTPSCELVFQIKKTITPSMYPQTHDFFEFILITSGTMQVTIHDRTDTLKRGSLLLIRPQDIHSVSISSDCSHINLAFQQNLFDDMFRYLNIHNLQAKLLQSEQPPKAVLNANDLYLLIAQFERLNSLSATSDNTMSVTLRLMAINIMSTHIIPLLTSQDQPKYPGWFQQLLEQLNNPELFSLALEDLAAMSGHTSEHLCRCFKKYLNVSPKSYLHAKRLNFASNLLAYSDTKIIDIAFASGFQSMSAFYSAFKKEYDMTPLEYRKKNTIAL